MDTRACRRLRRGKGVTVQCKKGKLKANNKGPGQNDG